MSVKRKLVAVPTTVAVVAALAIGYQVLNNDPLISLEVTFDSPATAPMVSVQLTDTVPVGYDVTYPRWHREMRLPPGTRVILTMTLKGPGFSECHIGRDGVPVSHDWIRGPGVTTCQHVVAR